MKLSLSENISSLRRASGLTQERLAEALGVSFAAVSKWERGAGDAALLRRALELYRRALRLIGQNRDPGHKRDGALPGPWQTSTSPSASRKRA